MVRFLRHHSNLAAAGPALSALLAEAQAEAEQGVDRPEVSPPTHIRKLSEAEKTELARDYLLGMTVYELAEKYSIQRQTASRHLHRMGVPMRQRGLKEEQIDQAAQLYAEGLTLKQVGAKLAADASTVRLALLRRGVRMREPVARR